MQEKRIAAFQSKNRQITFKCNYDDEMEDIPGLCVSTSTEIYFIFLSPNE